MRILIVLFCACISCTELQAQNNFQEFRKKTKKEYDAFRTKEQKDFEDFRKKVNEEYASLVRKTWHAFNALKGISAPKEDDIPPIIYNGKGKPHINTPQPIKLVIPIIKQEVPQPQPVTPIENIPQPIETYHSFVFLGTTIKVRSVSDKYFKLQDCDEKTVATAWEKLSGKSYNNLINDCLSVRKNYKLCDWAYLLMLQSLSASLYGNNSNEAVLLTAYLYCQSGYKMRLAYAANRLYLLYASRHAIYDLHYWKIENERFYPFNCQLSQLHICEVGFPKERPLSLWIEQEPELEKKFNAPRTLQSQRYPEIKVSVSTNENLIKFYNTYPTSMIDNDFGTRWAMYAQTPLSQHAQETLYPGLRKFINGISQLDAVSKLLNFVQTAFVYEYDDKVWGRDRAFFADETIYYPYCDCEDRSILFSRLVRDLLGLKVALVYYPGHLSAAVQFNENISGDYLDVKGRKYVVCDPTYIGAPVGATMPAMNNQEAKVILLE